MKISLNWIKDFVSFDLPADELAHKLTMAGMEVEKIEKVGADTVFEFEITPNRADCLNMIGLAREIAAVLNKPLKLPKSAGVKFSKTKCDVTIAAPEACSRYIGTVIEGVSVKAASPEVQKRLTALGNRPISNIVDITNYCLFEIGQPLHAFDLDKLKGGKIIVRFAKKGERLTTLDGVERELDPSILVIADAERPVALAGIMGGANSEVSADTKNILLESAYFDPILIRRTSRKLGLASDSSYRFERGVVYDHVKTGADRAVQLMLESAGGEITQRSDVIAGKKSVATKTVSLDLAAMNAFLGASLSLTQVKRVLKALGCDSRSSKEGKLKIVPPCFRPDLERPVDIYEEIARIIGYDQMPNSFPTIRVTGMRSSQHREKRMRIADYLLSQGFNEVLTYTMLSKDAVRAAQVEQLSCMSVLNPLSKEQEILRPHLLPSLLQSVQINMNRGQKDLAFFETGKAYPHGGEKEILGVIMTGWLRKDWRDSRPRPFDFYDLKGSVEKMLFQFGVRGLRWDMSGEVFLEEGLRADVFAGKKKIGACGKVSDGVLKKFDIKHSDVFFSQIDLQILYDLPLPKTRYAPICEYPSIIRDVSLAVPRDVAFQQVRDIVKEFGDPFLSEVYFKEEYLGEKIPAGQRGLVFSVVYQSRERTLTEDEIQAVHAKVCDVLVSRLGATLR